MPRIDDKRLQELADKTIFARTNEFNDYVLRTIGRRIKATGRASAADQTALNNMKNISGDMAKIKKKLAETMELNVADVEAILTQTVTEGVNSYKPLFDFKGAEFIPFEQNEYAKFLVNHWAQETCEKMINLSRTKALCFDKYNALGEVIGTTPLEGAFQQAIDEAVMAVSTGTTDFNTAMKKTVERLGGSGVRVDYGNNITRGLPGMVRSNLLYGAKQAAQAYDEYIGEQIGCNGFEVDYHPGPRPTHAFMGGVMYSYNGDVVIDGVKYEDGSEALERLKDYGCLHFKMDVILGVSEPRYDKDWLEQQKKKDTELIEYNGKQKTMYQWKQGARRLETAVREQRDIAFMAKESGIKSLENQAKGKIADYRAAYDDLCDKVGIEKRYDRMATFPSKSVDNIVKSDIIDIDITENGKYRKLSYDNEYEYKKYIMPEYSMQNISKRDRDILWDDDNGYIQNPIGYKAINDYDRGLTQGLEEKYKETKTILNRLTSTATLKKDYVGYRKVDCAYLSDVMGIEIEGLTKKSWQKTRLGKNVRLDIPKNSNAAQIIADRINKSVSEKNIQIPDKAVTSISMCEDVNYFTHRAIQFEIQMPIGTKGLITDNWEESEFIAQANSSLKILGATPYNDGVKDCVKIFAELIQ